MTEVIRIEQRKKRSQEERDKIDQETLLTPVQTQTPQSSSAQLTKPSETGGTYFSRAKQDQQQ